CRVLSVKSIYVPITKNRTPSPCTQGEGRAERAFLGNRGSQMHPLPNPLPGVQGEGIKRPALVPLFYAAYGDGFFDRGGAVGCGAASAKAKTPPAAHSGNRAAHCHPDSGR